MNTVVKSGKERNRCVSTRFNLGVENEPTDVGRDGQTCLARPNVQARTGRGKFQFLVRLTTSRIGNHTS